MLGTAEASNFPIAFILLDLESALHLSEERLGFVAKNPF